jgi:methanogenic corrinoid protein MtbC1
MTTLADFSDTPKYTIKNVCTQTGIRAVTLRAWERRHEVLTPHRSENLNRIKHRVDANIPISNAIGELRAFQRNGVWPDAIPEAPNASPVTGISEFPPKVYAQRLYQGLIKHDESVAGDVLREVHTLFELQTIFTEIITPALVEIGEAWYRGDIRITTEHFASTFVRGKLLSLLQAYPSRRNAAYVLIGAAPTEMHEIPSLMFAVLLRSAGYRVEYLGPDIELEDLADYASYEHPNAIILSASLEPAAHELVTFEARINRLKPAPIFGYAGRCFVNNPALVKKVPGIFLGSGFEEALIKLQSALSKKNK